MNRSQLADEMLLVMSKQNHVDQVPYTLEPIGRNEATEHETGIVKIKKFKIGSPPKKDHLPVAAMPIYGSEALSVYRTKKRPAIIVSKGGTEIANALTENLPKWRTNRTIIVAPSYSVNGGFSDEFCERVQRCEYPQFMWDDLPVGGTQKGSIIRFDHLQPVGHSNKSIIPTKYCLSKKSRAFVLEWVEWLLFGQMGDEDESPLCETRTALLSM